MTRPLRTTLAAISLVLCGPSAVACVVSYIAPMGFAKEHDLRQPWGGTWASFITSVDMNDGRLYLYRITVVRDPPWPPVVDSFSRNMGKGKGWDGTIRTWLPYTYATQPLGTIGGTITQVQWTLPLPLLVLLFAILPIRWAILWRRERRRNAAKVCVRCGYDLRASSGRCSECGEPIPA